MAKLAAGILMLVVVTGASAVGKARVWLSSQQPLVVRGTGFEARERVSVTVAAGDLSRHRAVSATATGAFVVRFTGTSVDDACAPVSVRAVGAHGTYATWKRVTDCAPLQPFDR
ncbi:MAG TPA: hypothetical protein VGJ77_08075 [Gaiellaceae bacterium]|jgi:hypothetical protein